MFPNKSGNTNETLLQPNESRCFTTHWMLTELDVEYELVLTDLSSSGTTAPEFRAINPMGKIPTLVDGQVVVTEVAAICAYLADKFSEKGLAPDIRSPERGSYYRYLFVPGTTLEPLFTIRTLNIGDYPVESTGFGDLERCMATIEEMTPKTNWALGSQFSAADIVFGGTLDFAIKFGWIEAPSSKLTAYVRRLKNRPAYRQSHDESWH